VIPRISRITLFVVGVSTEDISGAPFQGAKQRTVHTVLTLLQRIGDNQ
jgi:hypothetical protein